LVLLAEIKPSGGQLGIRGREAGTPEAWVRQLKIPVGKETGQSTGRESDSLPTTSIPLGALFGREAIEDLELQVAGAGRGSEGGEFEANIENLALRHGIASRKTSVVAISEGPTVDPKTLRRR